MNQTRDRTLGDARTEQDTKVIRLALHQRRKLYLRAISYMSVTRLQRHCRNVSSFCLLVDVNTTSSFLQLQSFFPGSLFRCEVEDGFRFSFVVNPSEADKKMKGSALKWSSTFSLSFFFLYLFHLNCWGFMWQEFLIKLQLFLWHNFFLLVPQTHQISCLSDSCCAATRRGGSDLRLNPQQPTKGK